MDFYKHLRTFGKNVCSLSYDTELNVYLSVMLFKMASPGGKPSEGDLSECAVAFFRAELGLKSHP